MPEMDGLETSRRICQEWEGFRPHIIAITANAMRGDHEVCLAAGMDDYISKPIQFQELTQALSKCPRQRSLEVTSTVKQDERGRGQGAGGREQACRERSRTGAGDLTPDDLEPYESSGEFLNPRSVWPLQDTDISASDNLPPAFVDKVLEPSQNILQEGQNQTLKSAKIDVKIFQSLRDMVRGDRVVFAELIGCYLTETPKLVQDIGTAIATQDVQTVWKTAHQLKSSSASIGAIALAQVCKVLEAQGRRNELENTVELLTQLDQEYQQVKTALEKELAEETS